MSRVCRRWLYGVITYMLGHMVAAQEPVSGRLPDSLTRGAAMVKRMDETDIDIETVRKARVHHRYVYTILNALGDGWSQVSAFYDKFHDLGNVSATLYDSTGKIVKKIKKGELEDWNIDGMGMLMMDTRLKEYRFGYHLYPYTIAFDEETDLNNLFALPPQWIPQPGTSVAVVSCSLVIHLPADYPLQYRSYHLPGPVISADRKRTLTWKVVNSPAAGREEFPVPYWTHEARVDLAPGVFDLGDYKGSSDSWDHFGRFMDLLYRGRDRLPEAAKTKIHSLTDTLTDERKKVDVLYDYLQQNTHYVGIELGIGGWQPFDAASVYKQRYGDCKALANYMVALLKEAGIHAYPVLIRAGADADPIDTDIACNQFNHVIAAALAGRDTVWLECTSQTLPPGYLSSFTADRNGLLLDDSGGHLVHTPVYGLPENRRITAVTGNIDENGNLRATLEYRYSGLYQDAPQSQIERYSKKDLSEQLRQSLDLPNGIVHDVQYRSHRASIPLLEEGYGVSAERFALLTGDRMMIVPGSLIEKVARLSVDAPPRKDSFEVKVSGEMTDSIVLHLPQGWAPEGNLPNLGVSGPFGGCHVRARYGEGTLTLVFHIRRLKGVYPPEDYTRMVRAYNLVYRERNRQYFFVRTQAP